MEKIESNYTIFIPVRISDINYGGHLGHAELIKITHQARLKFFKEVGIQENDIDGAGVIVKELSVTYHQEAFFDEILKVNIFFEECNKASCDFRYELTKNHVPIATVLEKILFMNYGTRRLVRTPLVIKNLQGAFIKNDILI